MGTPINPLEKTANELCNSLIQEEKDLGQQLAARLDQLSANIEPLMKYLLHGGEYYTVVRKERTELQVTQDGRWLIHNILAKDGESRWCAEGRHALCNFPVQEVVNGLVKLTTKIEKAREERLNSIKAARIKLQEIQAILNR